MRRSALSARPADSHRLIRWCVVLSLLAGFLLPLTAAAQPARPGRPPRPPTSAELLQRALGQLATEAETVRRAGDFTSLKADFAQRFEGEIEPPDLLRALVRRAHRDPFIDAYIRWQLTSFDPDLPALNDRDFAHFMDAVPAFLENPAADPRVIDFFEQASRAGALKAERLELVRRAQAEMETRRNEADLLNHPAREYRAWVKSKLGETGPRPRQWMIEELSALLTAGWPVSTVKGAITRAFRASTEDETFTARERRMVSEQLRTLIRPGRRWVREITFLASGEVRLALSRSEVDQRDVTNWSDRLFGRE